MSQQTAGSALVETLMELGVERVWGLIGNHVLEIYDHLGDSSIEHIQGTHEEVVVRAAGGAARVSAAPAVVIVSAGPGATNTMTGVGEASAASIPMVVIAGNEPSRDGWHGVDDPMSIPSMYAAIAKDHRYVDRPTEVPDAVTWAFDASTSNRPGPVVLQIPKDVLTRRATFDDISNIRQNDSCSSIDEAKLDTIQKKINAAERPVLLAGQGACRAQVANVLDAVAARIDMPVGVTRRGLGAYTAAPRYAGAYSLQTRHLPASTVVEAADLVVGVGVRERERRFLADDFEGSIVYLLESPERHALATADAISIGELSSTLRMLASTADSRTRDWWHDPVERGWRDESDASADEMKTSYEPPKRFVDSESTAERFLPDDAHPVHPAEVVSIVNEMKAPDGIVTTDVGVHNEYAMQYLNVTEPYSFLSPDNWGGMGHGVPAAIGAKVAAPNREVIGIVGDGSFLMTMSSFLTATSHQLDVTVLLCNNHQHNAITALQDRDYGRAGFDQIRGIDYAAFAEQCGGVGFTVESPTALDDTVNRALKSDKPAIVDVLTAPNVDL